MRSFFCQVGECVCVGGGGGGGGGVAGQLQLMNNVE